jgi:hypothetical protein
MAQLSGEGKGWVALDNNPTPTSKVIFKPKDLEHLRRSMLCECCLTCNFWRIGTEDCIKFGAPVKPPLFVIVDGCKYYEESVPF